MKWKTLFLLPSLLVSRTQANTAQWLQDRQISLDEVVAPSAAVKLSDTPEKVEHEMASVKTKVALALENPERFCKFAATFEKTFCDQSKTLADFKLMTSLSNEMQSDSQSNSVTKERKLEKKTKFLAAYRFFMPDENQINKVGENKLIMSHLSSVNETISDLSHELQHAMISTHNLAICDQNDLLKRQKRFGKDLDLLSFHERIAAPYEAESKKAFAKIIQQGSKRLSILATLIKSQDDPDNTRCDDDSKKLIHCFENEVANFKTDERTFRDKLPKASPLVKIITQLFDIFKVVPTIHASDAKLLEMDAYIHQVLTDYPKLFNYLFPELREWHMQRNPEYQKCMNEIAPERLSLTCKI